MNFLHFTDIHFMGKSPSARKDDFSSTLLKKLENIIELSHKCDGIIFTGDFCDTHKLVSDDLKEKIIVLFAEKLKDKPFYYTWGQHDLYGNNYDTRDRSTTSYIFRMANRLGCNFIEVPIDNDYLIKDGNFKFGLTSCPSSSDFFEWIGEKSKSKVDFRISLVHHFIGTQSFDWLINYKDINKENCKKEIDLFLCGDLHDPFDLIEGNDGFKFINPGSIARKEKKDSNLKRLPKVSIINITDKGLDVSFEVLESAYNGVDIFYEKAPKIENVNLETGEYESSEISGFSEFITHIDKITDKKIDLWGVLFEKLKESGDNSIKDIIIEFKEKLEDE